MAKVEPLSAKALCWRCDASDFAFATTDELEDLSEVIGQERAVEAIRFGIGIRRQGYNLFALGPPGIGKHALVRRFLEEKATSEPAPSDWCYVNNFKEPDKPRALKLPAGRGAALKSDMERLVDDLRGAIPTAFESEEYRTRRQVIEEELKERQEHALAEVEREAKQRGIALIHTPMGFAFAPVREDKVVSPEVFKRFPKPEQEQVEADIQALQKRLQAAMQEAPVWLKTSREKLRELNREAAMSAVGHLIESLREAHEDLPEVVAYLEAVQQDVIDNVDAFLKPPAGPSADGPTTGRQDGPAPARRYRVNVLVDQGDSHQAPIVYEDNPAYDRLVGRIEHRAEMGALITDFNLIKPGALHRANGGYLILDARKLLLQPLAWQELKRALVAREIRIEPLGRALGLLSTVSLEPEPIPLELKVVLVGERLLYYLLSGLDPEFTDLFKVAADFDERIERTAENSQLYAGLLATLARREGLRPFDREAVARVAERGARLAGDAERLSTHTDSLRDLLREADYWAREAGRKVVGAADVERAIDAQIHRLDRVRERTQEEIQRGTILVDTDGAKAGQVNGLSVMSLGGLSFGRPSRITARVRMGRGEVADIEREVALGGPIHSKGVLILSGYLGARYAGDQPLSLSASLVFEQSYSGVEGDSASSAELYALLSALAEVPLKQSLAVTGSVNQHGEVQAIGGVNEKIEGFFDLCAARGLNGEQGVLIPASNVKHLMLRRTVVEAVEAGKFHIYPVETIDQGIEILTGMAAGERGRGGRFPEGTVNHRVEARLIELAEKRRAFGVPVKAEGEP
ncbi:MAG: AAA family ATPase [Alphaproteobacteria bacterium]